MIGLFLFAKTESKQRKSAAIFIAFFFKYKRNEGRFASLLQ